MPRGDFSSTSRGRNCRPKPNTRIKQKYNTTKPTLARNQISLDSLLICEIDTYASIQYGAKSGTGDDASMSLLFVMGMRSLVTCRLAFEKELD